MVTRDIFLGIVASIVMQRLFEVQLSRHNEADLRARGAVEHAPGQMPWMLLLHAAWLISMVVEVLVMDRQFNWSLAAVALPCFAAGQALRFSAIWALGPRWTVRILTLPNTPPVTRGVFRYLRHPNYLGVSLELAALPLVHSAWITAVVFTAANMLLLRVRIRAEEQGLSASNDYEVHFRGRPRWLPGRSI